jgi:Ca-activated chloride channel family protein
MSRPVLVAVNLLRHSPDMTNGNRSAWLVALVMASGCAASDGESTDNAATSGQVYDPRVLEGGQTGAILPPENGNAQPNATPMRESVDDVLQLPDGETPKGTNINLSGSQDFGPFRAELAAGRVPSPDLLDEAGFFAEHHGELPAPSCGEHVCLQSMLAVMGNLLDGSNCTMLQLGLNSPIAADADNRPPLSLAVVVDTSGSMAQESKIDFVRNGLGIMIDGLKDEDRFSLVTYDSEAVTVVPMTDVSGNRVMLRDAVLSLVADGSTNLFDGLDQGYREVYANYDSARQNRVILLSDGNPTVGITDAPSIIEMSRDFNSQGVGLTSIGLGTDFNVALMRDLALQADGNYYFLENAGAVSEVFDEELSFFTVPIAFDLSLSVTAGADYEFGRAVGSPLWENDNNGGHLEVPSVFIAHRESADDVTEDGGRRGGGSALLIELMPRLLEADDPEATEAEVATVEVSFREPGSEELVSDTLFVNYPHAAWELLETGYFANINTQSTDVSVVQKSFVMLNLYAGIEGAVSSFHENGLDPTQSIADLEALLAAVRDYNEEVQDTDIDYDIALVEQLISVMVQNNVPEPTDVQIPEDPWPSD